MGKRDEQPKESPKKPEQVENEIANKAFAALPRIKEVWVTADGHFHLDGSKGGEKFERTLQK